ncbi:MAG: OmpH family outer membrane protein [Bacteroides sp.]|nr:OmpH family outer membrane protein [Bacteroides sp.]
MKKNLLTILSLLCAVLISASSCGSDKPEQKKAAPAKPAAAAAQLPNYRYVNIDTVLAKYNLAIDYNEEMLRMQNNLEAEAKRHEASIKSFANSMQTKAQNNQYTQAGYEADQKKLAQMQTNAGSAMDKLQRSSLESAAAAEKVVQDSIHNFIEHYNASRHYDAIFMKAATLYINPALDITEEVVEGLNARYNKVAAK